RRHTRFSRDWSSDVCSSDLLNKGLTITLRDERPDHINGEPHVVTYRYDGGISDFVRYINAKKEPVHNSIIAFEAHGDGISIEIRSEERRVGKAGRTRRAPQH